MEKIKGKIRPLSLINLLCSLHQLWIHQVCANLHLKAMYTPYGGPGALQTTVVSRAG